MTKRRRDYLSFLLRMWRMGNDDSAVWRASLENPFTGERRGFAGLQELFVYLQAQTDAQAHQPLMEDEEEG